MKQSRRGPWKQRLAGLTGTRSAESGAIVGLWSQGEPQRNVGAIAGCWRSPGSCFGRSVSSASDAYGHAFAIWRRARRRAAHQTALLVVCTEPRLRLSCDECGDSQYIQGRRTALVLHCIR